jgi:1-acyl-sn-glycerol-3-phosphate acyltransferase
MKVFGWKLEGEIPPIAKGVFVASPHTSNWDMPHMLAVSWSLGFRVSWMGKKQMFRWPFGRFFRWLGGVSIDRAKRGNMVELVAEQFRQVPAMYLVIPVAGTRKRTEYWKSGFYHIARAADVPIACTFLDYARKVGGVGPVIDATGDVRADMDRLREFYGGIQGKHPELHSRIRLPEEDAAAEATG